MRKVSFIGAVMHGESTHSHGIYSRCFTVKLLWTHSSATACRTALQDLRGVQHTTNRSMNSALARTVHALRLEIMLSGRGLAALFNKRRRNRLYL